MDINNNKNLNSVNSQPIQFKCSRKILNFDQTPSLSDDNGYDLEKSQLYHANHRVILFYLNCVHRHSEALRTSGKKVDIKTWIGRTTMQGHRSKKENHHGSHCNTGTVCDNLYIEHVKIAKEEEKITPIKKKHFTLIGLSEKEIEIIAHPKKDPKAYKTIVARVKKFSSYISHTPFEQSMNMTVTLPRDSNLMIDKSIENDVRENFLPQTIKKVMQGEMNPVAATRKYVKVIHERLDLLSDTLTSFEEVFLEAYDSINHCIHIESKGEKKINSVEGKEYYKLVLKIKKLLIKLKDKSDVVVKFGLADLRRTVQSLMPRTRKKMETKKYIERTKILWRRSVGFSLNRESYEQLISVQTRIAQMHIMIAKQREGTVEPEYQALLNIEAGGKNKSERDVKKKLKFDL